MNTADLDSVRKFWNARPCNIRHSPLEQGTKEYFDQVEQRKYFVEPHIPLLAEFPRWKGRRVLEIGCGIGTDTMNFARAGAHVTAIDLSEKSLEVARQRAKVFGLDDRIKFVHGNAEKLGNFVHKGTFDLVYSFGVIHHTPNPRAVIEAIRPFMDCQSELRIMLYHLRSWKVLQSIAREGFRFWNASEFIRKHSEAQFGSPVTYAYTKSSVRQLLKGFEITRLEVNHIFPYEVDRYRNYEYRKLWYIRHLPTWLFSKIEHLIGWHLCITARLK